ncbi:hypothetical protein BLI708_04575 [Bifidobacterium imperatoris]|uniref:Poly(Hydroxyalcanoate) granule associated protein (Phasin) n=1 Tax=Bifidobacterium imperatoris TaxID=2020965 RepID=A0A2N5IR65_9BIFI|nr:hypothetical protein [Bifidobacterium imperatoris]PLS24446.1 hypothetical protein Tam1G_1504 [Bifidobacterium imperatoris]QSY58544.1 hypothetical protein BLI708_04575 [Bifidobacterium imperatoris]
MADFDLGEGVRKVLLAGIGALATGYEKSSAIVDDLVKKGELTVEQGKSLNTELKRKVGEALVNDANKDEAKEEPIDTTEADSSDSADKD